MQTEAIVRLLTKPELAGQLHLYTHLHPEEAELVATADIERQWQGRLSNPPLHYLVADIEDWIVSSCTLTTIPNLIRGARSYGLIKNVVTHPDFRRCGIGTQVLHAALALAWKQNCDKVMLLTGRKDEATLRFDRQAGFEVGVKTGFLARP